MKCLVIGYANANDFKLLREALIKEIGAALPKHSSYSQDEIKFSIDDEIHSI